MKIKITSSVVIGGKIQKVGNTVDVPAQLARELVSRGRAEHIAEGKTPAKTETPTAPPSDDDKAAGDKK